MAIFEFVLLMLAAVLLSNPISRFIPSLSAPLVQIVLGVVISLIPFGAFGLEFELEPELFFILFIAPLVFHESYIADKKTMWEMKAPIMGAAVLLVFVTVITAGYFTHLLIPGIPLAAAFALIGALGPTDDVAVDEVGKRVIVPRKIMSILSGESIINDASGIVCFQFAIFAMTSGSFSLKQASFQFILLGFGGLLTGVVLTWIKYAIVRWFRSLLIGNVTSQILIEVLTPFIVYMVAEALSVSGILAVFAAGIVHSFMREKFNPETVKLNIANDSVWEFLTFTLNGLVFVILGTQLPGILKTINNSEFPVNGFAIVGYVFLLSAVFVVLRFVWWLTTIRKEVYQEVDSRISAAKAAIVFSLSGARGTVTLASVMSIPLVLGDGTAFPKRDLIILLASGVIIVSLLTTNFVLSLFLVRKTNETRSDEEQAAYSEIVRGVITRLNSEATDENRLATEIVIHNYARRNTTIRAGYSRYEESQTEKELRKQIFLWEKENTSALLESETADKAAVEHFLTVLEERAHIVESEEKTGFFTRLAWFLKHIATFHGKIGTKPKRSDFEAIIISNQQYVLKKLNEIKNKENTAIVDKLSAQFELISAINRSRHLRGKEDTAVYAVAVRGLSIERELVQEMFEANRISRDTAKEMRAAILTLQTQLQSD